jgi:RNA polymerase sigma-70 factor (ECF subfamily)
MTTPDDISHLIARCALRDRTAFEDLYTATSAKLFGVTLRILKDRSEAEDSVQEIYVKIWNRADSFAASQYSPMSWLIAIARNHAIDRLRQRKPVSDDIDDRPELADRTPGPEGQSIARSEQRRIQDCIDELEADRAQAVRGAYLNGDSYQLLADRHNVPINTMRTWLRRSLLSLKECMGR